MIAGATNLVLSLTNAGEATEGLYQVVALSALGGVTSAPVAVRLESRPVMVDSPASVRLDRGGDTTFQAVPGGPVP